MDLKGQSQVFRFERRWPVVLTIVAVVGLLGLLPGRIRLFPAWSAFLVGVLVLAPIAIVGLTGARARWLRVERTVTLLFFVVAMIGTLANLANLVGAMIHRAKDISGVQLLASSIAVWATNVLIFSLLYWQIDRGGPEARVNKTGGKPDWHFPPEDLTEEVPPGWGPAFVDYLFLGFSTATAFSMTEAIPLTARAKILMMIQSLISLVTIVVVASRSINILGN